MEMSTVKTVAVFVIIFGCFAVLYPKIFHPMLMHVIGVAPKKNTNEDVLNRIPPHLRHGRPMGSAEDTSKNMRAGPHPGLRAAAEMKKQAATTAPGGNKGMMSVVLPMYAIGIVLYLLYTLTKVFGKKEKPPNEDFLSNDPFRDIRYDAEKHKFRHRAEEDEEEEEEEEPAMQKHRKSHTKTRDLENLLLKADERNINEIEMQQLKQRLMETESQMNRILKAMEMVQQQVGQTSDEHLNEQTKAAMRELQKAKQSTDASPSSPDMDSYEIISGGSSPIEEIGPVGGSIGVPGGSSRRGDKAEANEDEESPASVEINGEKDTYMAGKSSSEEETMENEEIVEEIPHTKYRDEEKHPDLRMRKTVDIKNPTEETSPEDDIDSTAPSLNSKKD